MNKYSFRGIFAFLLTLSAVLGNLSKLQAEPVSDILNYLDPGIVQTLKDSGEVYRYDREKKGQKLLPETYDTSRILRTIHGLEPDVLSEALYLLPYTEEIPGLNLELYNMLRAVRKISNVEYYSARLRKIRPLFDDVYRVDSLENKNPLVDDTVGAIPDDESFLLHMDEVNFGSAYFRLDYSYRAGTLLLTLTNVSKIRKIIKMLDEEALSLQLLIIPADEGFLIYGLGLVDLSNEGFINNILDPYSSFYRRLYALETWIYNTLYGTDRSPEFGEPIDEAMLF